MKCLKKSSNNRIKGTAKIGGFSKLSHPLYVCRFIKSPRHALLPPLMRAVRCIKMYTIYDTDLTNEHLVIIGKINASWSLLEFLLTKTLAMIIGIDIKECRIITRSLNADTKLKKIEQIAKFKGIKNEELRA